MAGIVPYLSDEEEKRKAEAKAVLERQRLAAGQATSQASLASKLEERMRIEDERKKNERIANAMGLSVQEKAAYLKSNAPQPVEEEATIPTGAETAKGKEVKRAPTPPTAPSPQGVDGAKPSVTKPVTGGGESQVSPTGALKSMGALATKIEKGGSNNVSKPTLDELTKTLDAVEATVSADPRFQNTPVERNLQSARAEAYKMYKEKADRNQLLGTVERAINAIAQFASAQAGFGTRQAGGNLPLSSADYGGQTAQAFKEYETEVGLIGEEQKAGERASDRKEALKEKEINRQRGTILERIETERNALKEAANEREAKIRAGAGAAAEARREAKDTRVMRLADSKDALSNLSAQIETTRKAMQLGNRIGTGKSEDLDKELAEFASSIKQLPEDIQAEVAEGGKEFFNPKTWGNPGEKERRKQVLSDKVRGLAQKLNSLENERAAVQDAVSGLRKGLGLSEQPSQPTGAPTPTPPPAGQSPEIGGKVLARIPGYDWRELSAEQFAAAKAKYPNIETK